MEPDIIKTLKRELWEMAYKQEVENRDSKARQQKEQKKKQKFKLSKVFDDLENNQSKGNKWVTSLNLT